MQISKKRNKNPKRLRFSPLLSCEPIIIKKTICPAEMDRFAMNMLELEEAVDELANGCYTVKPEDKAPRYKIRQMCKYAEKAHKSVSELTNQELEMFLIK
ncbi:hypothetical protein ASZ90_019463 [hydrocarbon metagenome]|uniref:Uncharacterized protein n=1 Tax=hydrocarbon metagenome TaxID=938273 RepID=A0A0W8E460_9ZZZZ